LILFYKKKFLFVSDTLLTTTEVDFLKFVSLNSL
jgi:hypothetical protein